MKNSKSISHLNVLSLGMQQELFYTVTKSLSSIIKPSINRQGRVIARGLISHALLAYRR